MTSQVLVRRAPGRRQMLPITTVAWGEITYPFLNFNGAAVEVWEPLKFGNG